MPNVSDKGVTSNTGAQGGDYWFMYNGTLFMSLNSNNTSTAEHKAFMKEAMDANPDAIWNVVTFHHSTYSVANHYTDSDDYPEKKRPVSCIFRTWHRCGTDGTRPLLHQNVYDGRKQSGHSGRK